MTSEAIRQEHLNVPWWLVLIVSLIRAFQDSGWGVSILGVLSVLLGIFLALYPLMGAVILSVVLGVLGLIGGVAAIVLAFKVR